MARQQHLCLVSTKTTNATKKAPDVTQLFRDGQGGTRGAGEGQDAPDLSASLFLSFVYKMTRTHRYGTYLTYRTGV